MIQETKGRLIAIGDIHGCDKILETVLNTIQPAKDDTFIFLGDLCNRGPNTKGVYDIVMNLENICQVHYIMGNHEEMIVAALLGGKSETNFWCKFGGLETLDSFKANTVKDIPRSYMNLIVNMKDFEENENFIFLHANYEPTFPMDAQDASNLRWDKMTKDKPKHMSGKRVVCGHTVHKDVFVSDSVICIDTGCGIHQYGKLSALDLKSGTLWQASARSKKTSIKEISL